MKFIVEYWNATADSFVKCLFLERTKLSVIKGFVFRGSPSALSPVDWHDGGAHSVVMRRSSSNSDNS